MGNSRLPPLEKLAAVRYAATSLVQRESKLFSTTLHAQEALVERAASQRRRLMVPAHTRLLVLGVISNQRTPDTRQWIRQTYMADASTLDGVLLRFVIGKRGLNQGDRRRISAERRQYGDLELIAASEQDYTPGDMMGGGYTLYGHYGFGHFLVAFGSTGE